MSSSFPYWPKAGPIDLAEHDLPHALADTEWWYVNTHVATDDGRELSLFAAFFRIIAERDEATGAPTDYAHSLTWGLSELSTGRYVSESRVDEKAPEMGLERLDNGRGSRDDRVNRAMREILETGKIPTPDRVFEGPVTVATDRLALDYGGARFEKQADGSYVVDLENAREGVRCQLRFELGKPPIRHGDDGVVRGTAGEEMFYYFSPRCRVTGEVELDGARQAVTGQGWYDHEFGGYPLPEEGSEPPAEQHDGGGIPDLAWNWTAIQLEDGTDISAYEIVDLAADATVGQWLILVGPDGERRSVDAFSFEVVRAWTSTRTFHTYPVTWRLRAPAVGLDVAIEAAFDDQELITIISKPAFWEGRCDARGALEGREVAGKAYIERSGFEHIDTLDDFFGEVGKQVRKSVSEVMPLEPSYEQVRALVASEAFDHYMEGVDEQTIADNLIAPVRAIVDRGGKSWRSYAALACCDVVGGDSRKFVQWLAMPELMHVGSLIVDDVQDQSELRRGGPTCHLVYGEPIAINAGTAAYFITQSLLESDEISAEDKLRLYDLYFHAMRAGHAGQAIDLGGLHGLMPAAVETGQSRELQRRILACHRLKTAAPAGCLARMGAVAGGGSDDQIEAVGVFFEELGLAFQIMDDVLNLRGFKNDLKQRGEDIANGAVTLPTAVAMEMLERPDRQWLWETLQSRPKDPVIVARAVELLETSGAIEACAEQARDRVEGGWRRAEPLLEPSISRLMLRAFGWYVLERHY